MTVILVPVSHLAKESRTLPRQVIEQVKPDYVALELDQKRFLGLFQKHHTYPFRPSGPNLLGFFLYHLQKGLGKSVGEKPGEEFIESAFAAAKLKAKVALVDQDIQVTLRKFSKAITLKDLARFVALTLVGKRVRFDISKMPSDSLIKEAMGDLKKYFPRIHQVFVEERNQIMASRVKTLEGNVVFVVGAGHIDGLKALLPNAKLASQVLKKEGKKSKHVEKKVQVHAKRG